MKYAWTMQERKKQNRINDLLTAYQLKTGKV
jgi:hypothetical protein